MYIYIYNIHGYVTLLTCGYNYNTIVHGLISQHFGHAGGPHLKGIKESGNFLTISSPSSNRSETINIGWWFQTLV